MTVIFETERLIVREWSDSPADLERIFDIYRRGRGGLALPPRFLGPRLRDRIRFRGRRVGLTNRWYDIEAECYLIKKDDIAA